MKNSKQRSTNCSLRRSSSLHLILKMQKKKQLTCCSSQTSNDPLLLNKEKHFYCPTKRSIALQAQVKPSYKDIASRVHVGKGGNS